MNFLEQLIAEWYTYEGYWVRTNLKFGKRPQGGWVGEMDVVAIDPLSRKLVHIETSMDSNSWEERVNRLTRKFDDAQKHFRELFSFPINSVSRIAVVSFSKGNNNRRIREDVELKTCPQIINEIGATLLDHHPLKHVVPENLPLLRAMQFTVHWGPQAQISKTVYKMLVNT